MLCKKTVVNFLSTMNTKFRKTLTKILRKTVLKTAGNTGFVCAGVYFLHAIQRNKQNTVLLKAA